MPPPPSLTQTGEVHVEKTATNSHSHLFSTNEPPSHIEIASLRQGVEAMVPWITLLRTELQILEENLRLHRLALSPTRRVPAEILHEIFGFVDEKTLLSVAMVCRAWYSASTSISARVLSTLEISFGSRVGIPSHRVRSWLAKPVKGIKTLKLHDTCLCDCLKATVPCIWTCPEFTGLLAHTPALESMSLGLRFSSASCFTRLMGSIGSTPLWHSLHSLELDFAGCWPGKSTRYRNVLDALPNSLKSLDLKFEAFRTDRSSPTIELPKAPFNSLKTLSIQCDWYSPLVRNILHCCVELEELSLTGCGITQAPAGVARVALPKVHTLSLSRPGDYLHIYQLLHLPSLTRLTICHLYVWLSVRNILDALCLISSTPPSQLQFLVLKRTAVRNGELWEVLSRLPTSLNHLVLDDVRFDVHGLLHNHHVHTARGNRVLPALRKLEVRRLNEWFDLGNFLLLVQSYQTRKFSGRMGSVDGVPGVLDHPVLHVYLKYAHVPNKIKIHAIWKEHSAMLDILKGDHGVVVHMSME